MGAIIRLHPCRDVLESLVTEGESATAPVGRVLLLQVYALMAEPTTALVQHVRHERRRLGLRPDRAWEAAAGDVLRGALVVPRDARL